MNIIIKTKNLEASSALEDYISEKFSALKKYINILKEKSEIGKTLAEVFVEVEKETRHHKKGGIFWVKAKIMLPGRSLMIKEKGEDIFRSVTAARDEMKLEIEKYKLKKIDKNRRKRRKLKKEISI